MNIHLAIWPKNQATPNIMPAKLTTSTKAFYILSIISLIYQLKQIFHLHMLSITEKSYNN